MSLLSCGIKKSSHLKKHLTSRYYKTIHTSTKMVHPLQTYLQIRRARPVIYSEDFSLPFCHSAKRMARQPRGVISWLRKVESTGAGGWSLNADNPSEKFLKKSLKVRIWDLASICNFSELIGTNFFLGRSGLACRAAYNCLAGTKKLLPAMYVTGYNFWCQHLTTVTKGRS